MGPLSRGWLFRGASPMWLSQLIRAKVTGGDVPSNIVMDCLPISVMLGTNSLAYRLFPMANITRLSFSCLNSLINTKILIKVRGKGNRTRVMDYLFKKHPEGDGLIFKQAK